MEDFDILYTMKTPFFMGSFEKVPEAAEEIEVSSDDQRQLSLKNLFLVRALTAKNDFPALKQFLQDLLKDPS
jgi:hypothetical protein